MNFTSYFVINCFTLLYVLKVKGSVKFEIEDLRRIDLETQDYPSPGANPGNDPKVPHPPPSDV
ncbi:hypothetical protein Lalb_Chr02g0157441 [Lupinus albus]|uniref:Uncharacterized protein n=1 Tax=Lupinus albus TaxID=3870 RepID=A0A6A4R2L9_LUPAL|nr:hypothetical protein Lalb_Chr02g0157441 [Lupinus albus]